MAPVRFRIPIADGGKEFMAARLWFDGPAGTEWPAEPLPGPT